MSPFDAWVSGSLSRPTSQSDLSSLTSAWGALGLQTQGRTVSTACLRPTSLETCPIETLRGVVRLVKEEAICLLVHEQEYGTAALYVHSTRPITKLLPAKVLESVDVQPQRALNFTLVPPFNGDKIQQAMNYCCSTQVGFNAALVQREINLLTIFEDPTSFLPPNLANWFTVCSVFGRDVSSEVDRPLGVIQIQGPLSGAQELDIIQATLQARPEVVANKVTVNANSSGITVEPRHNSELLVLKEVVLETLRDLGIPHGLGRSHLVLYKVGNAPVLGQCAAEVEVSPSPDCGAGYANLSSCDVVYKVLPEMGYSGRLRRTHDTFAFDLVTPKCKGCAHKIASALLKPAPGGVDYSRISLTLSRNVLLVSPTTDPGPQCIRHVTAVLLGLGIATSVLFAGPADRDLVDAEDMQSQYQLYTQPVRAVEPPSSSTNILEVALREGSISCPGCGEQVQKLLPALRNVVVDQARSVVMLEHATEQVAEVDVVNRLETLGYQPKTLQKGKQLLSAMHTALANRPAAPVPTPDTSESETLPGTELAQYDSLLNMSCVAAFTAKVYLSPDQPATTTTIMLGCHPDAAADELGYHLFIKSPTGEAVKVDPHQPPIYLENAYTIWYDKVVDRSKPNAPECTLIELDSFKTLQDFWRVWQQFDLLKLQEGDVILVFRNHVQPNIHHPVNKGGGRWYTRALPLETRVRLWTGLVLAMLGENLEDNTNNEVCGVVLSVKPGGDRIEVWVDGDYYHHAKHGHDNIPLHRQLSPTMGDILARVLQLNPGRHRLHYWTHVAYERHRKLHSGSARRDKRKHKMAVASQGGSNPSTPTSASPPGSPLSPLF
jgi:hypothetical protein